MTRNSRMQAQVPRLIRDIWDIGGHTQNRGKLFRVDSLRPIARGSLFSGKPILIHLIPRRGRLIHDSRHIFFKTYVDLFFRKSFCEAKFQMIHSA
jgi:hypothetical protein